ncbi:MAG: hypothetical protein IJU66_00820, partial [Oscillospiraceae bacterium]|nr:hypothetical protein [Oscillospiraceae bacterium]
MRLPERSPAVAARAAYLGACTLVTVFYLYLPIRGYERMMEEKYVCFLAFSACLLAAALCTVPPHPPRMDAMRLCAASYLGCSALSALCSPFGAKTLLGGTRCDGLLALTLYAALFFFLARCLRPDRRLLRLAAVSVSLCCLLVHSQISGLNPFGMYPDGLGYHDGDAAYAGFFAGTSGNVDFTAFLLALALCVLSAAMLRSRLWSLAPAAALVLGTLLRLRVSLALLGL